MAAPSDDPDPEHSGIWVRAEREFAGMTPASVVARLRHDPLHPMLWASEEWLAAVEAGVGVLDLTFADITSLSRATKPPRPDWWEEGYEHDLRFSKEGHATPATPGYRRYWARVATVREELRRYRAGGTADPHEQLRILCELLNSYDVAYVLVGSGAAIGHGAEIVTKDIDVVPRTEAANLERLCEVLNVLGPRWYDEDQPEGRRIDGRRLETRHFAAEPVALSLQTRLGALDVVLRPRGFETGYEALAPRKVTTIDEGVELHLASLDDIITSKELLDRPKDREQLPALYRLREERGGEPG